MGFRAMYLLRACFFAAWWWLLPPARAAAGMLLTAMLICASFIDLDHMIIPDRFSIGAAAIGVVVSVVIPSLHGFHDGPYAIDAIRGGVESLIGVLIGSGVVLWIGLLAEVILRKEAMGFGDVKLVGAIGAFFGWQGAVFCLFGGAVLGTLGLGVAMIVQGLRRKRRTDDDDRLGALDVGFGREVPFGPMLAAGSLLYFLWLHPVVDRYFAEVAGLLAGDYGPR
jgi:leader peptidase (prepilin peptidase)/N-methyltransferase